MEITAADLIIHGLCPFRETETQDQVKAHMTRRRWNSMWSENERNGQGIYLSAERCLLIKKKKKF